MAVLVKGGLNKLQNITVLKQMRQQENQGDVKQAHHVYTLSPRRGLISPILHHLCLWMYRAFERYVCLCLFLCWPVKLCKVILILMCTGDLKWACVAVFVFVLFFPSLQSVCGGKCIHYTVYTFKLYYILYFALLCVFYKLILFIILFWPL